MIMTKLRWHSRRKIITVEMVKEYSRKFTVPMSVAKRELETDNTENVLQYRNWYGKWIDVPFIVERFE